MAWFIPVASFVGRTFLARPILSTAGTVIAWEMLDADGNIVGEFVEDQLTGALNQLSAAGGKVAFDAAEGIVGGIGDAIPEIIERIGPSVITGINNTVEAIRNEMRGNEVKVLTTFMIFAIMWATSVYVLSWVRGAGMRAGE